MEKEFYVYIYLDSTKLGTYEYETSDGVLSLNYEPIYVGKGKRKRIHNHWNAVSKLRNELLRERLRKIENHGKSPEAFIRNGLTEKEAFKVEEMLIERIGRIKCGSGPLCNLTSGNQGTCGMIHSKKTKKILSKKLKKRWGKEGYQYFMNGVLERNHKEFVKKVQDPEFCSRKGSQNGMSKLNDKKIIKMRKLFKEGFRIMDIAVMFKIKPKAASAAIRGFTWGHIPGGILERRYKGIKRFKINYAEGS